MKAAVLVIDVQQGLCQGPNAAYDSGGLIERINALTRRAREKAVRVIFIQHESKSGYLEYLSDDWQLATGLEVESADLKVRKTTPDSFLRTNLEDLLKENGVEHLVVCGMHSEFCVDTTTRKALALGFPVTLVADGHTSAGNGVLKPLEVIAHHNETLTNISSFGPRAVGVATSDVRFDAV